MVLRFAALAGASIVLTAVLGCATTRAYERRLDAWVGKSKEALVARWGEPSQAIPLESGRTILEYRRRDEEHGRLDTARQVAAERKGAPPVGCRTQFLVGADGRVERWKWVGDHCVAK